MKVIKRLDDFILPFSIALIGGFEIAWTFMQNPRFDMSFNAGLAIPAGLIVGLILGGAKAWFGFKMPRSVAIAGLVWVGIFSVMPLFQILANLHAASIVVPILMKDGFIVRSASSVLFLWIAILMFFGSLGWGGYYLVRQSNGKNANDNDNCSDS